MLQKNFIPVKPFPDFKWKWASLQCTEGLNDPVVLLGVLFRMRKLEPLGVKYSSDEFARELVDLSNDVKDSVGVDLARRTGERNLIRNSGQYWRALGLIEPSGHSGKIALTDFGRKVADHDVSQTEFAAITIQTFKLPNPQIQENDECQRWISHGLVLYPLRLLLQIILELENYGMGYITTEELVKIIIPLSGCKAELEDYVHFIIWYRAGEISLIGWPDCCTGANDMRIAREYLLFLSNYGYLNMDNEGGTRMSEQYHLNTVIAEEIKEIVAVKEQSESMQGALEQIRESEVASEVERKRIQSYRTARPNQANFRRDVLKA